eukprot:222118-Alexandrium_andersonii.AAC.1
MEGRTCASACLLLGGGELVPLLAASEIGPCNARGPPIPALHEGGALVSNDTRPSKLACPAG